CACSQSPNPPPCCPEGGGATESERRQLELTFEGSPAGAVLMCRATPARAAALEHLTASVLRRIELERANASLRSKLTATREEGLRRDAEIASGIQQTLLL